MSERVVSSTVSNVIGALIAIALLISLWKIGLYLVPLYYSLGSPANIGPNTLDGWPPAGSQSGRISTFGPLSTLQVASLISMVTSAVFAFRAGRKISSKKSVYIGLSICMLFGIVVFGIQAYIYKSAFFSVDHNLAAALLFIITGIHGAFLILGIIFFSIAMIFVFTGHISLGKEFGLRAAQWYWYFVTVLWLVIYSLSISKLI